MGLEDGLTCVSDYDVFEKVFIGEGALGDGLVFLGVGRGVTTAAV